jgi:hypothetical protein
MSSHNGVRRVLFSSEPWFHDFIPLWARLNLSQLVEAGHGFFFAYATVSEQYHIGLRNMAIACMSQINRWILFLPALDSELQIKQTMASYNAPEN